MKAVLLVPNSGKSPDRFRLDLMACSLRAGAYGAREPSMFFILVHESIQHRCEVVLSLGMLVNTILSVFTEHSSLA